MLVRYKINAKVVSCNLRLKGKYDFYFGRLLKKKQKKTCNIKYSTANKILTSEHSLIFP